VAVGVCPSPLHVSCGMSDKDDPLPNWQIRRASLDFDGPEEKERIIRYRHRAADIRARAATMPDPTIRQKLLDVANQYEALARSIEGLRR
jgi:hypothetical protein